MANTVSHRLHVLWCRTFQAVLKVGNYFMGYRMPHYLDGPGAIRRLPAFLKERSIHDVLVVTDAFLLSRGMPNPMLEEMEQQGIRYTVMPLTGPDPTSDDVVAGYKLFAENGCKSIIALGGGSSMDCAKGIAAKAAHPRKRIDQLHRRGMCLKQASRIPSFRLEPEGIHFVFPRYEVGYAADGEVTVKLPYNSITPLLTPEMKDIVINNANYSRPKKH